MARAPSNLPVKLSLLQALKAVPPGRVTTFETLGASLGAAPVSAATARRWRTPKSFSIAAANGWKRNS